MTIELNNESGIDVDESAIVATATFALRVLHVHPEAELALVVVDEAAMELLHVQWMNEPGPTDVLSFPMDELRPGVAGRPSDQGLLGDIVLCPQVAESQALATGHSLTAELSLLTVHGLLHLLGFDHAEPEEEAEMFMLQREILDAYANENNLPPIKSPTPRLGFNF